MLGIPYFPHFTKCSDSIRIVQAKFGIAGYGVIYKLYERIYSNGYYCLWNEKICNLFAFEDCRVDSELVCQIVNLCLEEKIFNEMMLRKHSILTSAEIQRNYYFALFLKKEINIDDKFRLINIEREKKKIAAAYYSAPAEDKSEIFALYENAVRDNKLRKFFTENKRICSFLEDLDPECLIYAFEICLAKRKRSSDYLFGVINNLKKYGVMYLEDIYDSALSDPDFLKLIKGRMKNY